LDRHCANSYLNRHCASVKCTSGKPAMTKSAKIEGRSGLLVNICTQSFRWWWITAFHSGELYRLCRIRDTEHAHSKPHLQSIKYQSIRCHTYKQLKWHNTNKWMPSVNFTGWLVGRKSNCHFDTDTCITIGDLCQLKNTKTSFWSKSMSTWWHSHSMLQYHTSSTSEWTVLAIYVAYNVL
jgi:hypothetical protein